MCKMVSKNNIKILEHILEERHNNKNK